MVRWNPTNYDIDAALAGENVVIDQYVRADRSLQPEPGDGCYVMATANYGRGRVVAKGVVIGGPTAAHGGDPFVLVPLTKRVGCASVKLRLQRFDRWLPDDVYESLMLKYRGCDVMQAADANMLLSHM